MKRIVLYCLIVILILLVIITPCLLILCDIKLRRDQFAKFQENLSNCHNLSDSKCISNSNSWKILRYDFSMSNISGFSQKGIKMGEFDITAYVEYSGLFISEKYRINVTGVCIFDGSNYYLDEGQKPLEDWAFKFERNEQNNWFSDILYNYFPGALPKNVEGSKP